jgi:MOSC domain-containing protein YiiM
MSAKCPPDTGKRPSTVRSDEKAKAQVRRHFRASPQVSDPGRDAPAQLAQRSGLPGLTGSTGPATRGTRNQAAARRETEPVNALTETRVRRCPECGFDPGRWRRRDVADLLDATRWWWDEALRGRVRTGADPQLSELRDQSVALAASPRDETPTGPHDDDERMAPADRRLLDIAHRVRHLMMQAADLLGARPAASGGGGSVAQINQSGGGVPKTPVASVAIGWDGLDEDRQADRKHHGRPYQAVCLWSVDVIEGFRRAGHPIHPGSAGENLTVSGLVWGELRPGAVLEVGGCRLELSFPAVPCQKQARWFSDGDISRLAHDAHPGSARWYAWVRRPGQVSTGDRVVLGS